MMARMIRPDRVSAAHCGRRSQRTNGSAPRCSNMARMMAPNAIRTTPNRYQIRTGVTTTPTTMSTRLKKSNKLVVMAIHGGLLERLAAKSPPGQLAAYGPGSDARFTGDRRKRSAGAVVARLMDTGRLSRDVRALHAAPGLRLYGTTAMA